jgi:hypothetical protein
LLSDAAGWQKRGNHTATEAGNRSSGIWIRIPVSRRRELAISSETFHKWRSKYGGIDAPMTSRMKEPEAEDARLCKTCIWETHKAEIASEALQKAW